MNKVKIVLSDLHVGAGRVDEGNRLEDFDQDDQFGLLLERLSQESTRRKWDVELILAGDVFEFLQVPVLGADEVFDATRTYPQEAYAPSDEDSSRRKMQLIIEGHPVFFSALSEFIALAPRRTVTFVKGNHDVNLHWDGVQDVIRSALNAVGERKSCLEFEERAVSREGIYVEHGNQYLEWINRWPDFEQPHDPGRPGELYMPPGSRFVYLFLNDAERQHYWLDGVKPITALLWYLFALDFYFAIRALHTLLGLLPALLWGSLPIGWAVAEFLNAHQEVLAHIGDRHHLAVLDRNLRERSTFYNEIDAALALYSVPRPGEPMSHFRAMGYAALPRGQEEQRAQRNALIQVASSKHAEEGSQVIVFGHVHDACVVPLEDGAVYLNAGTWTWHKDMIGADYAQWLDLFRNPDKYTRERRLSYVRIDYDANGRPKGKLMAFEREPEQRPGILWRFLRWIFGRR